MMKVSILDPFTVPLMPDIEPIMRLHRGSDGYISFHNKDEANTWHDLVAVPAATLPLYFPGFIEELHKDSYFSVNASYKGVGRSRLHPNLPKPYRPKNALRWLTSAFCDLDFGHDVEPGRPSLTVGRVIGEVIDMQDAGVIPPVSMFVRSGRGLWLFWILVNDDPRHPLDGPVRAWPETVSAYCRVQRAIARCLAHLDADHEATDPSRVTRVPGSLNSKSNTPVSYWFQADSSGRGYTYTLSDLCRHFRITARKVNPTIKAEVDPAVRQLGQSSLMARWVKALAQFETLRSMRGGFRVGMRYTAAKLLGSILTTLGKSHDEIVACVSELGAECLDAYGHPYPLEEKDIRDAIKAARTIPNLSAQRMADLLQITPAESLHLETWPMASKFGAAVPKLHDQDTKPVRAEQAEKRRERIRHFIQTSLASGEFPTFRAIQGYLSNLFGETPSPQTLQRDLDALGIKNPRKRKGKPSDSDNFLDANGRTIFED